MKLALSVLQIKDEEKLKSIKYLDVDYIHLDIMDGIFVPNKTDDISDIIKTLGKPIDVHLMVSDVISYINKYALLHPEFNTFHVEAVEDPIEIINYIKSKNIKAGISIKPNTSIDEIRDYLDLVDLVLVMSVEPGYGGQKYLDSATNKINELKAYNGKFKIEVDGGINDETIKNVKSCDMVVVGSYITNGDYETQIKKIKNNF